MDLCKIYDKLDDVYRMLDHLKSRQYTRADIPLNRRDELSVEITEIQSSLFAVMNDIPETEKQ